MKLEQIFFQKGQSQMALPFLFSPFAVDRQGSVSYTPKKRESASQFFYDGF